MTTSYKDVVDENFLSIGGIIILSFLMISANTYSILSLIYTNDAIENYSILNSGITMGVLDETLKFYTGIFIITFIVLLSSHIYGYRNIFKYYISFVPSYYIYICVFIILFISVNIINSDNPCKTRRLFNCSLVRDETDINNNSITKSAIILAIFDCVAIIMVIILSILLDKVDYCKLICLNLLVGLISMILPLILFITIILSPILSGCQIDCDDCKKPKLSVNHQVQKKNKAYNSDENV